MDDIYIAALRRKHPELWRLKDEDAKLFVALLHNMTEHQQDLLLEGMALCEKFGRPSVDGIKWAWDMDLIGQGTEPQWKVQWPFTIKTLRPISSTAWVRDRLIEYCTMQDWWRPDRMIGRMEAKGYEVVARGVVPDDPEAVIIREPYLPGWGPDGYAYYVATLDEGEAGA